MFLIRWGIKGGIKTLGGVRALKKIKASTLSILDFFARFWVLTNSFFSLVRLAKVLI